ncbi:calcium-binding protein [Sulfuricurvum sp.]|uniref:calcium-binding protein n=1 Tax=Sulfuricurvum sp. TaxID=2025608 RepID=UPI00262A2019|nr:calcium-binding protein [Sulfuricurvum sp.]MDD3597297.1 calcium-binding protein [Sulfuricurvum sp.]
MARSVDSSNISPLVLDLDGDGIEVFGISDETHVVFDHDGDGVKNGTGWVSSDDGLLVMDRNGNGTIDNGSELFGVYTEVDGARASNGFIALEDQDTNSDGIFDSADTNFSNVRVWKDLNGNGISESFELFTLEEMGIVSFNLNYTSRTTATTGGNVSIATSTFTKTDGSLGRVDDINFITNNFYREFKDTLPLDEIAISLPDIQGSGMVRDLAEASMLSSDLQENLVSMINQGYISKDDLMTQIDAILLQWADTSSMKSSIDVTNDMGKTLIYVPYGGSNIKVPLVEMLNDQAGVSFSEDYEIIQDQANEISRKIEILERFNNDLFLVIHDNIFQGTGDTRLTTDITSFNVLRGGNSIDIGSTPYIFAHLSPYQFKYIEQSYDALKDSIYSGLVLQTRLKPYIDAIDFVIDESGFAFDMSQITGMLNNLAATDIKNAIIDWDDIVYYTQEKLDLVDDSAMVDLRSWFDTMVRNPLLSDELKQLDGLMLHNGILNVQNNNDNTVSVIISADIPISSSGDDYITGSRGIDIFDGGDGNDTIITSTGADILKGGKGNDTLIASSENDTLDGGMGNDILQGGVDNDLYLFSRDSGHDTIFDSAYYYGYTGSDYYNAGNDTIQFGEGISADDVVARVVGNDLILALREEGKSFDELSDTITITDWYNVNNRIENIVFADGTVLNSSSSILALMGTDVDDTIVWTEEALTIDAKGGNDTITVNNAVANNIHGGEGNDSITTGSGADTLYGGAGDDVLASSSGNDTVYGDEGDDFIRGGNGIDILYGGEGNDFILGDDETTAKDAGYADILIGGAGDDVLRGGSGDDTYVFNRGDGHDTIYDNERYVSYDSYYNAGNDTIQFGEGISADDVVARVVGNDLILALREEGKSFDELSDTITITDWYNVNNRIENIVFADGTVLNSSSSILALMGTDVDDTIVWTEEALTIDAKGGNDTITVNNAVANNIHGGEGNDSITTGSGADTLYGGAGDDVLQGGTGNDTYVFNLGDGKDTIYENLSSNNELTFNSGSGQLSTTQIVKTATTGQQVSISFEMTWDGSNYSMPVGFYQYDLFLYDGRFGFNTGYGDLYGISNSSFLMNSTHMITAVFTQGNVLANKLYIDGIEQSLSQQFKSPINSSANITKELNFGGWDINSSYSFGGVIDNIQLHDRALTTAEINLVNQGEVINNGLIANYDFEGETPYSDKSGNNHTASGVGTEIISSSNYIIRSNDTIQFGEGIGESSVAFYMNGNNLVVSYGDNDLITVTNQSVTNNAIEKFTLSDGNYLTSNDLNTIIQSMNAYATANDIAIESIESVKANQDLMNIVAAGWHQ